MEVAAVRELTPWQVQAAWIRHMKRGEWADAWRISDTELQRRRSQECAHEPRHLQLVWDGRSLEARRVLVHCYHGLGDTVQLIRLLPLLRGKTLSTIVWAQPPLIPLLRTAAGIDELLPLHDGEPQVDHDVDIEVMELLHALRLTPETLPRNVPYFNITPVASPPARRGPLKVGLVWQSGGWDTRRSISWSLISRLVGIHGIQWQILQRGPALTSWPAGMGVAPRMSTVLDEAVAVQRLDLLISVDTLSAHLAGALGVPTWTLLPFDADWRWLEGRDDSPWYPTMRLFRQSEPGDWSGVIERVAASLGPWKVRARADRGARLLT